MDGFTAFPTRSMEWRADDAADGEPARDLVARSEAGDDV